MSTPRRPIPTSASQWARRLALVWIAVPAVAIVLAARSCTSTTPTGPTREPERTIVVDEAIPAPGVAGGALRKTIVDALTKSGVPALLPTKPSSIPELQRRARLRGEITGDSSIVTYVMGDAPPAAFSLTTSSDATVCQEQSALTWSSVAVGNGEGCLAVNPNGGLFVEWVDNGHGVHVETVATDADALLAWLSTWK